MEKLLKSQAASGNPEQFPFRGLLEGFSQLVSDFIEACSNFILDFLHTKTVKKCEKTFSAHSKSTVVILGPSTNFSSIDIVPLNNNSIVQL